MLPWFRSVQRRLPWRDAQNDPYAVWISEVMLQQTTVSAAIPYFERWMARFPTVSHLAEASIDDVLMHWAGLGYYARARNIHKTAKAVSNEYGGKFPNTVHELRGLPGIGPYTAGAILSIAFQQDAPLVDVNVVRVLSRIFGLKGDPKTSSSLMARLWFLAEDCIPPGEARDFNQALMELGALLCTPAAPNCSSCPVRANCRAFAANDPESYPQARQPKIWKSETHVSLLISDQDQNLLLGKRGEDQSLWGGLWEFPRMNVIAQGEVLVAAEEFYADLLGCAVQRPSLIGPINHVVANRKTALFGVLAQAERTNAAVPREYSELRWIAVADVSRYALATPQRRLFKLMRTHSDQLTLEIA